MKDQTCKRCTVGIDDDGDGNCAVCADLTETKAAALRVAVLTKTTRAMDAGRGGAFDEAEIVLRNTREKNPIIALRNHQGRYPGALDFFNARHAEETGTVPIFNGHCSPIYLTRRGNPKPVSVTTETIPGSYRGPVLEALNG